MIQETSIETYKNIQDSLGERQLLVYNHLKQNGPANNKMIAKDLMLPINSITPRVYELRILKFVGVSHEAPCPITKRKSIFWKTVK